MIDLLIRDADQVVTVPGQAGKPKVGPQMGEVGVIPGGAVAIQGERIIAVGPTAEVMAGVDMSPACRVIDARSCTVVPGFVDPHTHLIYAGSREDEFALRLRGATYREIMEQGGGIMSTVRATRAASYDALYTAGRQRLDQILELGTTTVEVKSGYGLSPESEILSLRVTRDLGATHPVEVVPTFLGAHSVPAEYKQDRATYLNLIINQMIPMVAAQGLAVFADVFCEEGVFSIQESRRILERAREFGLALKLHADELVPFGGAELAAELGAVSADHLIHASDAGLEAMARAGVTAVVLPGTSFFLGGRHHARARRMIELGVPMALATDHNPGTCTAQSIPLVMAMGCVQMGLSPEEALTAATYNAACAVGRGADIGSIEPDKQADLVLLEAPNYRHLVYRLGINLVRTVIKKGRVVVEDGRLVH